MKRKLSDGLKDLNAHYSTLFVITFIIAGLIGAAALLLFCIMPSAEPKSIYVMDRKSKPDSIVFLLKADTSIQDERNLSNRGALVDSTNLPSESLTMYSGGLTLNNNPTLLLWLMMMSIMTAVAFGILPASVGEIYKLRAPFKPVSRDFKIIAGLIFVIFAVAVVAARWSTHRLFSGLEIIHEFNVLLNCTWPIYMIIGVTTFAGSIALLGIFLVNSSINELASHGNKTEETLTEERKLEAFNQLIKSLKLFLTFISVLIMFSIVTSSLLQQSLKTVIDIVGLNIFPDEFIYSYGAVFSIFLAAVYIPVYHNLKEKGESMKNELLKAAPENGLQIDKIKQFELKEGPLKNLQIFLTILAPILSSTFIDVIKQI